MRDPFTHNAEAEWRAGTPRPKPCTHRLVNVQTPAGPIRICATCGKRITKEPR